MKAVAYISDSIMCVLPPLLSQLWVYYKFFHHVWIIASDLVHLIFHK